MYTNLVDNGVRQNPSYTTLVFHGERGEDFCCFL